MNILLPRWSANALVTGMFTIASLGCVPYGSQYGYGGSPVYGSGYYGASGQPYYGASTQSYYGSGQSYYGTNAVNYGGWRPGYAVSPYRTPVYNPVPSASRPSSPVYRPAASTHPVPSIPWRSRSGGSDRHDNDSHS